MQSLKEGYYQRKIVLIRLIEIGGKKSSSSKGQQFQESQQQSKKSMAKIIAEISIDLANYVG